MLVGLSALPRRWVRWLMTMVLFMAFGMVMCATGLAAPRANATLQNCQFVAEIAFMTRAMALEGIEQRKVEAVALVMYPPTNSAGKVITQRIVAVAFRKPLTWSPTEYGEKIGEMCLLRGGDLDEILGIDS